MRSDRRWARFYFDDFIRDYPDIYADDQAFAAWMRLLVVAEKAWPAVPELPRSVRMKSLDKLRARDLVAVGPGYTFALKGFHAERTRRHQGAIVGANASANARATAGANAQADAEPIRERERDETNAPPPQVGKRSNGTNPRALGTSPRQLGTSPRQIREDQKRGAVPVRVHDVLSAIATKGKA